MDGEQPNPVAADRARGGRMGRPTAEFLVALALCVLVFRTFATEAYVVPTGSMAPTLIGYHRQVTCPHCGAIFSVGDDGSGPEPAPYCLNCGRTDLAPGISSPCGGDRLLVQKFLFDLRPPRRWEVAVFQTPNDPRQSYVKRVVGLPGESILLQDGDLFIDGKIARKAPAEQRALRILVFDQEHPSDEADQFPRWVSRRGEQGRPMETGWRRDGGILKHEPKSGLDAEEDWLYYRHWDRARQDYGQIRDDCPYNGADFPAENRIRDVMVEAKVALGTDVRALILRITSGGDAFRVTIPADSRGPVVVRRNGRELEARNQRGGLSTSSGGSPLRQSLEASVFDRRLCVAIDGVPLFDPIDYDDPQGRSDSQISPIAIGVIGGSVALEGLKVYRDVYYTERLESVPTRPFAVGEPYQLGPDEFFVLGDNSPLSNDSRFWPGSPVVRREWFVGKPFLVHLPSRVIPFRAFGGATYWVPDLRAIRYIH